MDHIFDLIKSGANMPVDEIERSVEQKLAAEDYERSERSVTRVLSVLSEPGRTTWIDTDKWQCSEAYSFDDIMSRDVMMVLRPEFVDFVNASLLVANQSLQEDYDMRVSQGEVMKYSSAFQYNVRDDWSIHWLQVKSSETGAKEFLAKLAHKNLSGMNVGEFLTRNRVVVINANSRPLNVNVRGERYTLEPDEVILGRTSLEVAKNVRYLTRMRLTDYFDCLEYYDPEAAKTGRLMGYWSKYLR
jgi:hypothetical protein